MDVKKPGPFFEASPNNFYLDKLSYKYDTDEDEDKNSTEAGGQQEVEESLVTAPKDKRMLADVINVADAFPPEAEDKSYVHIALKNK